MKFLDHPPPKRLFIIGNGFDLMHNLKTSYNNFRTFLVKSIHHTENPSHSQSAAFFVEFFDKHCKGPNWSDIEAVLLNIAFDIDDLIINACKKGNSTLDAALLHIYFQFTDHLYNLTELFKEWVESIQIDEAPINLSFLSLVTYEPCAFLNFNYTLVLEKIYNFKNICHIHGHQGENIVFGHCGNIDESVGYWLMDEVYGGLCEPFMSLKKQSDKYISENKAFFDQSPYWHEIYSYGFSFSKVDIPYLLEICEKTKNLSTWYLSDYDSAKTRESYMQIIRECGFNGSIRTFHIKQ